MGDKCPADLYIFASGSLKVDNSSLTGESEPQERVRVFQFSTLRLGELTPFWGELGCRVGR